MKINIINTIKSSYPRDVRKQVVKTILIREKEFDSIKIKEHYKIINQIMSYVLKELNWSFSSNSNTWDETPLEIMKESFPNIEKTAWYKEQQLLIKSSIDVVLNER